uniref:A disintegrin and metalloproteinase with thrombospondin motifs adt-2-like n=1 Tax=Ciona intestinalis TaxID=7719 RepID=UPI000EF49EFB|nr:A disintegrin and metalloproteinase with thrombospondin motifs adt-2-like [Ciona intestinalis]|eukprot:XP_026693963.1 A disintegrin and metalloproteinase with thrombospondin motifs adt-2-like [Ciona intestinalis]
MDDYFGFSSHLSYTRLGTVLPPRLSGSVPTSRSTAIRLQQNIGGRPTTSNRCSGSDSERRTCPGDCLSQEPPNGQPWLSWGSYSGYGLSTGTGTCGVGSQTRYRRCFYLGRPDSRIGNDYCTFTYPQTQASESRSCNRNSCPTQSTYTWTIWSSFSQCNSPPGSCQGTQTSSRTCINPVTQQQVGSVNCRPGVDTRTQSCNSCSTGSQPPTYGQWSNWGNCGVSCTRTRARCRTGSNCRLASDWDVDSESCNCNLQQCIGRC